MTKKYYQQRAISTKNFIGGGPTTRRRKVDTIKRFVNKTNVKNKLEEAKMKIREGLVTIEEANDVIKDLRLKKIPRIL